MKQLMVFVALVVGMTCLGCGAGSKIVMPTDKLTAEQEAQIKRDDAKVADEESQGAKRR